MREYDMKNKLATRLDIKRGVKVPRKSLGSTVAREHLPKFGAPRCYLSR